MEIKKEEPCLLPVDITEWNETQKAFLDVRGFSVFLFNQRAAIFYNDKSTPEEKFKASFEAALLGLVDENDAPLLKEEDEAVVRQASFRPLVRMFNVYAERVLTNPAEPLETFKKN